MQALALLTTAVSGWLTSCAMEAVSSPMVVRRVTWARSDLSLAARAVLRQILAHVTRLTTMGELTASIAHEVNQPLTAVVNNANACISLLEPAPNHSGEAGPDGASNLEDIREALGEIRDDAERASAVVVRVRQLAKRAPVEKSLLDLRDVVKDVLALARYESAARRVTIRTDLSQDCRTSPATVCNSSRYCSIW